VQPGRDVSGDLSQDLPVGGERRFEEALDIEAGAAEALRPGGVDEVGVHREVELDVPRAGLDRIGRQPLLDLDRVLDELLERTVGTGQSGERVPEDRGRRERHFERVAPRQAREERCFPRRGRVHPTQPAYDLVDPELDLAPLPSRNRTVLPVRTPSTAHRTSSGTSTAGTRRR
jgi:hypothetical protein